MKAHKVVVNSFLRKYFYLSVRLIYSVKNPAIYLSAIKFTNMINVMQLSSPAAMNQLVQHDYTLHYVAITCDI